MSIGKFFGDDWNQTKILSSFFSKVLGQIDSKIIKVFDGIELYVSMHSITLFPNDLIHFECRLKNVMSNIVFCSL